MPAKLGSNLILTDASVPLKLVAGNAYIVAVSVIKSAEPATTIPISFNFSILKVNESCLFI